MVLAKWTFHILKYCIGNWGEERRLLYGAGTNPVAFTRLIFCCPAWTETNGVRWGGQTGTETMGTDTRKIPKVSKRISGWRCLSLVLADLFSQPRRRRWGRGEVVQQPEAAAQRGRRAAAARGRSCCSRGCCEGQRVRWGGELKGLTGTCWGSPGTGKEAKARGGQFRFRCRSKSAWGNDQISSSPLEPFQQLKAETLIPYLQREETLDLS